MNRRDQSALSNPSKVTSARLRKAEKRRRDAERKASLRLERLFEATRVKLAGLTVPQLKSRLAALGESAPSKALKDTLVELLVQRLLFGKKTS